MEGGMTNKRNYVMDNYCIYHLWTNYLIYIFFFSSHNREINVYLVEQLLFGHSSQIQY